MKNYIDDFIHFIRYIEPKDILTIQAYESDLNQYQSFLKDMNVTEISYQDVLSYIDFIKDDYQISTLERKVVSIRQFHQYLARMHRFFDPTQHLSVKGKGRNLPHFLTPDDIDLLLSFELISNKDILDYTILLLLYYTGLRVSECTSLTLAQVYRQERWLRIIGKRKKERMVPVNKRAMESLTRYIDEIRPLWSKSTDSLVFYAPSSAVVSRQYIHTMIQKRVKEVGLKKDVSAHTLRHSFATTILNEGVDLRIIQELLGHQDIATTQIYTHVSNDALKKAYDVFLPDSFTNNGGNEDES